MPQGSDARNSAEGMEAADHDARPGEMAKWSAHAGIPAHALPLRPYSNGRKTALDFLRFGVDGPRMAAAVRQVVRRERVDLVYVNGPRVLPAVLGVSAPVVFHAHSHVGLRYGRKLLEWTLQRAGAQVIAASRYVAQSYAQVLGDKRVQVIYNGIADFQGGSRRFGRGRFVWELSGGSRPKKDRWILCGRRRRLRNPAETRSFLFMARDCSPMPDMTPAYARRRRTHR